MVSLSGLLKGNWTSSGRGSKTFIRAPKVRRSRRTLVHERPLVSECWRGCRSLESDASPRVVGSRPGLRGAADASTKAKPVLQAGCVLTHSRGPQRHVHVSSCCRS